MSEKKTHSYFPHHAFRPEPWRHALSRLFKGQAQRIYTGNDIDQIVSDYFISNIHINAQKQYEANVTAIFAGRANGAKENFTIDRHSYVVRLNPFGLSSFNVSDGFTRLESDVAQDLVLARMKAYTAQERNNAEIRATFPTDLMIEPCNRKCVHMKIAGALFEEGGTREGIARETRRLAQNTLPAILRP